jgi:hypothetical protein
VTQYSYERFLSDVFGHARVTDNTQRQTEQASLIAPDKDEHGALVTERDARKKSLVRSSILAFSSTDSTYEATN